MTTWALGLQYIGSLYHGWQMQSAVPSIQLYVEKALSKVAATPIRVICAGRTDQGVHAWQQVIHFKTHVIRPMHAWVRGVNTYLPADISVQWAKIVDDDFHARFGALSRQYHYVINNVQQRSAVTHQRMTWWRPALDVGKMQEAAQYLLGNHDFSSFRGPHCQAKTPRRTISHIDIKRHQDTIIMCIEANAFLHHMVRNIMGMLLCVGEGQQAPAWAETVLMARQRVISTLMAPADGLYLTNVYYPAHYEIPMAPDFLY